MKKILLLLGLGLGLSTASYAQATLFSETFDGTDANPPVNWYQPADTYSLSTVSDRLLVHMTDSVGPIQPGGVSPSNYSTFTYDLTVESGGTINMAVGCKCVTFDIDNTGNQEIDLFLSLTNNSTYTNGVPVTIPAGFVGTKMVSFAGKFINGSTKTDSTHIQSIAFQAQGKDIGAPTYNLQFLGDFYLDNVQVAGYYSSYPTLQVYNDETGDLLNSGQSFDLGNAGTGNTIDSGLDLYNYDATGNSPGLTITSATITGTNAADFSFSNITFPTTIAADDEPYLEILFSPSTTGTKTAVLTFITDDPFHTTYIINLTGTGVVPNPEINVQDDDDNDIAKGGSYNLGPVASTTTQTYYFYIQNNGTSDLQVSNIVLGGTDASLFTLSHTPTYPATIEADDDLYFKVTFAPTSTGYKTATVTITNSDSDEGTYTITLNGTATPAPVPDIQVNTQESSFLSQYDIGNGSSITLLPQEVGNTGGADIAVRNEGGDIDLNLASITITGTNASEFSLVAAPSTPYSLSQYNNVDFGVSFTPTSAGSKTATLTILSNDPDEGTFTLTLKATALAAGTGAPEVNVEFNYNTALKGSSKTLDNVGVGATGNDYPVRIDNTGSADLTVSSIVLGGTNSAEFSFNSTPSTPITIAAGDYYTTYVHFTPTSAGAKTATLTIASDDADEGTYTITLHATAVPPIPVISVYGTPKGGIFTLPNVAVSHTGTDQYVYINNNGTADLTISGITLTGTNASEFSMENISFPLTINGGNENYLYINFAPTSTGAKTATLTIASDDPTSPTYTITLKATAVATPVPDLDIYSNGSNTILPSGGSYKFADVLTNTVGYEEELYGYNSGSEELTISDITITGTNASEFLLYDLPSLPATVDIGDGGSLGIVFAPTSPGAKTATLTITSDDPNAGTYTINLMATSVATAAPEIKVVNGNTEGEGENESEIASGGMLTMASVLNGTPGNTQYIDIENIGLANLTISNITLTGANASEFVLDPSLSFPTVIIGASGYDLYFGVTFVPTSVGAKTATLTITSNDSDEATYTITLNAASVATAAPNINVMATQNIASNGTFTMYDVIPGIRGNDQYLQIENLGSSDLNISSITLTGTNASEFIIDGQPSLPFSIVSGDYREIDILFAPTSLGTKTATLTITSNDADEASYVINLTANATTTSVSSAQSFIGSSKVYPNPTSDMATLELNLVSESSVKVVLSDLMGKEVMTIAEGNYSSLNSQFSVSNLSGGLYTITYFVNGGSAKSELLMVK